MLTSPWPRAGGPPPLARRPPGRRGLHRARRRTTSARAETTAGRRRRRSGPADHLRSRGDHTQSRATNRRSDGPPPLARRPPRARRAGPGRKRTTSARAETTPARARGDAVRADHLRSRGDHRRTWMGIRRLNGPPPLARRPRERAHHQPADPRTTSARAETTPHPSRSWSPAADHLRSRGDHARLRCSLALAGGLPPLARRPHRGAVLVEPRRRTTSARAETTITVELSPRTAADHLRSRGDHIGLCPVRVDGGGPPPLARRPPHLAVQGLVRHRTTSARAETTAAPAPGCPCTSDHLRSRGDHVEIGPDRACRSGPPPLARRPPPVSADGLHRGRTTSARAETTTST